MKIFISNTKNIPFSDTIKIVSISENKIITSSIVINKIASKLLNNFNDIHTYIKIWNDIVSYGKLTINDNVYDNFIKTMWLNPKECIIWVNLYTIEKERKKWYAKIIKKKQIEYVKQNYPNIKKIVWWTTDKKNLKLYLKYWATFTCTQHIFDTKIYLYYYNI